MEKQKQNEIVNHLTEIYTSIANQEENPHNTRYENMMGRFANFYGEEPEFYTRVPSFIQLFGENHTESGYGNLSFCGEQDIVIAFSKNKLKEIIVNSMTQSVYPTQKICDLDAKFHDNQDYLNLLLIGIKAATCDLNSELKQKLEGIKMLIDINFPKRRSLGFSNALAMAICLTCLKSFNIKINYNQIIQNLQRYKNVVRPDLKFKFQESTLLMAQPNNLLYLDNSNFEQKQIESFYKQGYTFLIADSLTNDPTLMTGGKRKDLRNCEIRIAIRLILQKMQIKNESNFKTLYDIQKNCDYSIEDMIEVFRLHIEEREYTKDELEAKDCFGALLSNVCRDIPYQEQVLSVNQVFNPFKRGMHVLKEAKIVEQQKEILQNKDLTPEQQYEQTCDLMNQHFDSLKNNFECASKQVEQLRELMIQLGCKGVKLLGSKWDGALLGICTKAKADAIIDGIMQEYYMNPNNKELMVSDDLASYTFKTTPCRGAVILDPQYEIWFC